MKIEIFTDGAATRNGYPDCRAGWGIAVYIDGEKTREDFGKVRWVDGYAPSNNRGELQAIIEAYYVIRELIMKSPFFLDYHEVVIYSDSSYCIDGLNSWMYKWKKFGWARKSSGKGEVKNLDLWKRLYNLRNEMKKVKVIKVKGHSGISGNERADKLAVKGSRI